MSAGNPICSVRIPRRLLEDCKAYLEERAKLATVVPWTLSELIIRALYEKLDKTRRGRKRKKRVLTQTELDDFLPTETPTLIVEESADELGGQE